MINKRLVKEYFKWVTYFDEDIKTLLQIKQTNSYEKMN